MTKKRVRSKKFGPNDYRFLRQVKPLQYETRDGRFAVWTPKSGVHIWYWFDGETGEQRETTSMVDAMHEIQAVLLGHAAPGKQAAAPTPEWMVERVEAAKAVAEPPKPALPAPKSDGQLTIEILPKRTPKLSMVALVEVDGRQVVVGFDGTSRAHTLWTEAK